MALIRDLWTAEALLTYFLSKGWYEVNVFGTLHWGQALLPVNFLNLQSSKIDCRDAFLAALCFKDCISGPTKPKTKHTSL